MDPVSGTIIIVNAARDDAVRYARMLRAGLSDDLDIATAANIHEGITLCREGSPYCVLLAHQPPTFDGFEFVASLKFSNSVPIPPTVLICGRGQYDVAGDAAKRDVDCSLAKEDVSEKLLVHAVQNAADKAALRWEISELRAELVRLQFHDPVTGLATRRLFEDRARHAVDLAMRLENDLCLLLLGIDGLREVYEDHGLLARDRLLREIGQRLEEATRQADIVARLDHDDFVVLMESGATLGGAEKLAARVAERLETPFEVDGEAVPVRVNIGISMLTGEGGDAMVRAVDAAQFRAGAPADGEKTRHAPDRDFSRTLGGRKGNARQGVSNATRKGRAAG